MDSNSTEVSLMLDTYAAEALSIGFIDNPLRIEFSDKKAGEVILSILKKANFFNDTLNNIRSLAKYGDLFYQILQDETSGELSLRKVSASSIEIVEIKGLKGILGFKLNALSKNNEDQKIYKLATSLIKDNTLKPWDVIQFTIPSDDYYPYGRPEIERIRSAYDQLITMEALFAISRANRVERIVIKVPTNQSNPTSAFAKLQQLKANIKSVVLGTGSQGRFTANKEWGLTDILFMPNDDKFDIDKLSSNIDISSDEDVRYFLEKMINGSRLPKGFLSGDEVTDRGNMLAQQDLRFSRAIIPLQQAYVAGVVKLCTILGVMLGAKDLQVEAFLEKPTQITQEQIGRYAEQIAAATNYIQTYLTLCAPPVPAPPTQLDPTGRPIAQEPLMPKIPVELFVSILMKFGVPESIAKSALAMDGTSGPDTVVTSNDSIVKFTTENMNPKELEYVKSSFRQVVNLNPKTNTLVEVTLS